MMKYARLDDEFKDYLNEIMVLNLHVMSLCYTKDYELKVPIIRVIYKLFKGYSDEEVIGLFNTNAAIFDNTLLELDSNDNLKIIGMNKLITHNDNYIPVSSNESLFKYNNKSTKIYYGDNDIINSTLFPSLKEVVKVEYEKIGFFYNIIKDNPRLINIDLDKSYTDQFRRKLLPVIFKKFGVVKD